jgi:acetyltransferase-like isoleucine patch superfamily enzyme
MDERKLTNHEIMRHGGLFVVPDAETDELERRQLILLNKLNALPDLAVEERQAILREAWISVGFAFVKSPIQWQYGHIAIGSFSVINWGCRFLDNSTITIGDRVMISTGVTFSTSEHPMHWTERYIRDDKGDPIGARCMSAPIVIEDDVWIGAGCIILPGVTIGMGSVVGAGSVVTRDIAPHSVAYGTPARVMRALGEAPDARDAIAELYGMEAAMRRPEEALG